MTQRVVLTFALICLASASVAAQDSTPEAPPAHISFVDGGAVLERDGQTDASPGSMPLLAGDRIRTQGGRVEILFADGSALHVDSHTVIDFQSDEVVRLLEGRMRLSLAGRGRGLAYRIDAPAAWVEVVEAGEYRVAVLRGERDPQVELAVVRGAAELVNEDGRSLVRAGERAFARAGARPSAPYVFNSAAWDAFDQWSESRRDQRLGVSGQYLPSDVRPYAATFDHHGSWRYAQEHGYVWYPRVHANWRPYYHGRWVSLRPYGWTWIAGDPWGWPTHHYGRWGFSAGAWFWIPGRHWGAAWVSWAHAPGYVSWCPLGWNNRPVFSFINVNIHGGRRYDPWHAWTVVPRRHFGRGFVNVNVLSAGRIDSRTHRSFVVRDRGPEGHYAVPRASAPIRTAGVRTGYAIPRGSLSAAPDNRDGGERAVGERNFPSPSRQPRPDIGSRGERAAAPSTSAPQRAVPRDRTTPRDTLPPSAERTGPAGVASSRVSPQRRESADPGSGANEAVTVPSPRYRAVPRRADGDVPAQGHAASRTEPGSSQPSRTEPGSSQRRWGADAYRTTPDRRGSEGGAVRERAVPRQDAPRSSDAPQAVTPPSYEAPRSAPSRSYEPPRSAPPRSYEAPRSERSQDAPRQGPERSYGSPRGESRPSPSAPSAERPSGSGGSGEAGSRSRGGEPSRGQATRRPGGRTR